MFGYKLKSLRTSINLSQEKLGRILGLTKDSISNLESGKEIPTFNTIIKIAKYFDIKIDYLFNSDEDNIEIEIFKVILKKVGMWDYNNDDISNNNFEKIMKKVKNKKHN